MQEATADDLLFPVAYQLADLCRLITLEPGDVDPHRHARELAADAAGRRRRGRDLRASAGSTNTIEEWDVDLAGPGEQMQVSAQTLHVALAIPEDEAERMVAEGREP